MIEQAVCTSFLEEILQGIHLAADTYKIALYTSAATLNADTTAYSATNEVANGNGYTTGGATLTGFAVAKGSGKAWLDFNDASWPTSSITARGALIYNSSRSNKAVMVIDFGANITSTNGTFLVTFPAANAANALLRLNGNA
jgi:hypothetical protein